jgi:hypothetical protein
LVKFKRLLRDIYNLDVGKAMACDFEWAGDIYKLLQTCYTEDIEKLDVSQAREMMRNDIWNNILNSSEATFKSFKDNGFRSEYKPSSTAMHYAAYLK